MTSADFSDREFPARKLSASDFPTGDFPITDSWAGEDDSASKTMGGFSRALTLLEFDQIRLRLASYTRTAMGQERASALTPSCDLLDIATRQ